MRAASIAARCAHHCSGLLLHQGVGVGHGQSMVWQVLFQPGQVELKVVHQAGLALEQSIRSRQACFAGFCNHAGQAQGGTPAEFGMAFTMDANRSLTITLHEVYLALAKTPIEGPAGVEASFDFRAAFNATAGRMMTVVLRNQQVGTEYG